MNDYLIVAYITLVAGWYFTLPVLAILALWLLVKRRWITAGVLVIVLAWFAIAAYQFARYM